MVVYGCFSGNMRIIHWFYGGPPLTHLPWWPVAKVLFFGNGSSGDSEMGGLRNWRNQDLIVMDNIYIYIYIYIFVKHLLNIYKDDLCMIQNHIQILEQNSLDGIF